MRGVWARGSKIGPQIDPGVRLGQNFEADPAVATRSLPEAQNGQKASQKLSNLERRCEDLGETREAGQRHLPRSEPNRSRASMRARRPARASQVGAGTPPPLEPRNSPRRQKIAKKLLLHFVRSFGCLGGKGAGRRGQRRQRNPVRTSERLRLC